MANFNVIEIKILILLGFAFFIKINVKNKTKYNMLTIKWNDLPFQILLKILFDLNISKISQTPVISRASSRSPCLFCFLIDYRSVVGNFHKKLYFFPIQRLKGKKCALNFWQTPEIIFYLPYISNYKKKLAS